MSGIRNPLHVDCPWFVGMGFFTADADFDPVAHWPGTQWQKIEGRFILAASAVHLLGETGGEENHTLIIKEIPAHGHDYQLANSSQTDDANTFSAAWVSKKRLTVYSTHGTQASGGGQPHNNMPPYITRIYWERVG